MLLSDQTDILTDIFGLKVSHLDIGQFYSKKYITVIYERTWYVSFILDVSQKNDPKVQPMHSFSRCNIFIGQKKSTDSYCHSQTYLTL